MRCGPFLVGLISVLAYVVLAEESVKSGQCNSSLPFDRRINPDKCCKKSVFKPDVEGCLKKTREMLIKRYREAQSENTEDPTNSPVSGDEGCMANCLTNNDIFQNDEINRDELVRALETLTEDGAWALIHSEAVDNCIEILQSDFKNIQPSKSGRRCNRATVLMMICLNGQYFANCPETHFQNDDENCKKLQEHIKTCPMPILGLRVPGHGKKGRKERNFKRVYGFEGSGGSGTQTSVADENETIFEFL